MKLVSGAIFTLLILFQIEFNAQTNGIEEEVDSIFQHHLNAHEFLTGGAIGIYSNDSVYLEKGYGWANVEKEIPFDPQNTLIQIASVTKLITTTAILQLVEDEILQLDADISKYLGEGIVDNEFDEKVTIRHLLTHTAGIDDRSTLMYAENKESILSLEKYTKSYLPQIVWEPGKFFNYSNHAYNLLAYLVEKVSQQAFNEYIQEHILLPLEMNSSGIGYNLPKTPQLMMRYNLKANEMEEIWVEEVPLNYSNIPGATDFKTTVSDMSNFIKMYLNDGKYKGKQVLDSTTIAKAFATHFSYDTSMHYQQGLGWRILKKKGIRLVYHEGDDKGIESALYLYPERKLGIFMEFNNQVGYQLKKDLKEHILAYFFPSKTAKPKFNYKVLTQPSELTGKYYYMNDAQSNFEKIVYLFKDNCLEVKSIGDTLSIGRYKYLELKPLVFDLIGKETGKAAFIKNKNGKINYLSFGTSTYQKLNWWNQPELHRKIILFALIALFICLILSWFLKGPKNNTSQKLKKARWIQWNSTFLLLFFVAFFIVMNFIKIGGAVPMLLKIDLIFPLIALIMLPYSLYKGVLINMENNYRKLYRTVITIQVISSMIILFLLHQYHMLGFDLY